MTDRITELEVRLAEAERLIESALNEWTIDCQFGDCSLCSCWRDGGCSAEWSERENAKAFLSNSTFKEE